MLSPEGTIKSSEECSSPLTLEIQTDYFPHDVTWYISDTSNNKAYSGGNYTSKNTLYTEEICVDPDVCYIITMYHSNGHTHGSGYYKIYIDNHLIKEGGEDLNAEKTYFCMSGCPSQTMLSVFNLLILLFWLVNYIHSWID